MKGKKAARRAEREAAARARDAEAARVNETRVEQSQSSARGEKRRQALRISMLMLGLSRHSLSLAIVGDLASRFFSIQGADLALVGQVL